MLDIFGRCNGSPALLPRLDRIEVLRRLAAVLQANEDAATRWLGAQLHRWLQVGGDFRDFLKIRPERGSRMTVQALIRQEQRDQALLALAMAAGSAKLALEWLRGEADPPARHADRLAEAKRLMVPSGPQAVTRAKQRLARRWR